MNRLLMACGMSAMLALGALAPTSAQEPNTLTAAERAAGWTLLFDGKTTSGWRGFRQQTAPAGWQVVDGALTRVGRGGDLITVDQFDSFELAIDWQISPGGNSGIIYRVSEDAEETYYTGPEMQVLDNAGHADGKNPLTSAGSDYALYAPVKDVTRPVGEWNTARLVVNGSHVEHWLNGTKLLEYTLGSPEWTKLVAASKFNEWPMYGKVPKGHIALQDHGSRVRFRNIKIRPLAPGSR